VRRDEDGYERMVERWLLEEGHLVPLWTEPGVVFVDRRVAGLRERPRFYLPDLREAHLLPPSVLAPFDLRP